MLTVCHVFSLMKKNCKSIKSIPVHSEVVSEISVPVNYCK